MAHDRWWRSIDERLHDMVGHDARVLDVGCGNGDLVEYLRRRGVEAFGVDPRAPERRHLARAKVEELDGDEQYDAVVAVMSLHHADLGRVCEALTRRLRAEGVVLVWDFDWPAYDERAARWLAEVDASASDHSIDRWRSEHADLHTGKSLRTALERSFELESEARVPYLARMLGRHDLETAERERIDAGLLPTLGLEYVCRLRSSRGA